MNLKHFIDTLCPDFVFLSEAQLFQCDLVLAMELFRGEYCSSLNSSDLYDPSDPLMHSASHGGTMIMWKIEHDPYVSVIPSEFSSYLPILFSAPGCPISVHIAVYLPTHGKDNEFLEEISKLNSPMLSS